MRFAIAVDVPQLVVRDVQHPSVGPVPGAEDLRRVVGVNGRERAAFVEDRLGCVQTSIAVILEVSRSSYTIGFTIRIFDPGNVTLEPWRHGRGPEESIVSGDERSSWTRHFRLLLPSISTDFARTATVLRPLVVWLLTWTRFCNFLRFVIQSNRFFVLMCASNKTFYISCVDSLIITTLNIIILIQGTQYMKSKENGSRKRSSCLREVSMFPTAYGPRCVHCEKKSNH